MKAKGFARLFGPTQAALAAIAVLAGQLAVGPPVLASPNFPNTIRPFTSASDSRPNRETVEQGRDIPELRTRTSRTYASAKGQYTKVVYPGSVNFRDRNGKWQPIDNTLVRTQGTALYQNRANGFRLQLPTDLAAAPIGVLSGTDWLTFAIQGAGGPGVVTRDTITYRNALPGVSVELAARNDALKETLVLADSRVAGQSFNYLVKTSPGLHAKSTGSGAVVFVNHADEVRFTLAPPVMADSSRASSGVSRALSFKLAELPAGYGVTLLPDAKWLSAPERKYPVFVDPTVTITGAAQDCYLLGGVDADTSFCGGTDLDIGYDTVRAGRSLLQFDLSTIPVNSQILSTELGLNLYSASTLSTTPVSVHRVTTAWTATATWNTSDGTALWTTAGGDFDAAAADTNNTVGGTLGWNYWHPNQLVSDWVNGVSVNNGFLLKESAETVNNMMVFYSSSPTNATTVWPYLTINYQACTAPAAPTNVIATRGNMQASVSWTAAANGGCAISGQTVTPYVGTTAGTPLSVSATATSATVTGLTNGTTYTIQVSATNAVGIGPAGASNSVTPATVPDAPTGATSTAGNAQATVSWTAPVGNGGSPVTGYVVTPYIGATAQTSTTFNSTATTQTVTSLTNGTAYTFTIAAFNDVGTGPASAQSNSVTPLGPPGAPTNVSAVRGNAQATVSWTAPSSTGGSPITGYVVTPYIGSTAQTATTFNSTATTQTVTGLTNGTAYTFTVAAINAVGTGPASSPSASVTPATVSGAPTGVSAIAGDAQATVSWTAPSSNGGAAITGYVVTPYIGSTSQTATTFNSTATTQSVTGLTNGTTYTFTVAAINAVGTGPASAASAGVTPATIPGAPTNVTATAGNGQATVSWTAPVSNGGSAITGYTVTPYVGSTAGTPVNVGASATSTTVTGLVNGTTYYFKVAATNAIGTGPAGTSNSVTPTGAPDAPGNVVATSGNAQASVTWTAPFNGGAAITGYTVTPYIGTTAGTPVTVAGTATSATVTGLTNGTTYTFRIFATNSVGNGPSATSNPVIVGTPTAPGNVQATAGTNQATVTWVASTPNASAITGYTIVGYSGTQARARVSVGGAATQVTVYGLQGQTAYTFQVTGTNSFGSSPAGVSGAVTPTGSASTYASTVLGDSPSAYWRLDDPSGSVASDTTGRGFDGTYWGSVTLGQSGLIPSDPAPAAVFDGGSAFVSAPTIPALQGGNTRSVEIWFSTTSTNGQVFFDSGTTGVTAQLFEIGLTSQGGVGNTPPTNTPGLYVAFGNADVYLPGLNLGDGRTHHVVVTLSGRAVNVYVDGRTPQGYIYNGTWAASLTSQPFTLPVTPNTPANPVWIGHGRQNLWSGSAYLSGTIGQVAVYPTVLTLAQVQSHEQAAQVILSAPVIVSVTAGSNQATVTWTDSSNTAAFPGFIVIAYQAGTASVSKAVSPSATTATLTGLVGGASYTIQVSLSNAFSSVVTNTSAVTPTGSTSTYASTVESTIPPPVFYYRLSDSGTTIAADSSGFGQTGTYVGTPTTGAAGALANDSDPAVTFGSGYVTYSGANIPSGNATRSVELWLKTTSTGYQQLVKWGDGANFGTNYDIRLSGGSQIAIDVIAGQNPYINLPYSLANGQWHQLILTFDGSVFVAYVDGKQAGSYTYGGLNTSRTPVTIGNGFPGSLDEVAVYSAVLTSSQANAHFLASGNSQPAAPATVTATAGTNAATVTWTASATNPYPITGYLVTAYAGAQAVNSQATGPSATSATISGLNGGVAYTFSVAGINNFGLGNATSSAAVTPGGVASTYASSVIGTGPVGNGPIIYWRLGEGPGSSYAADSSGNGRWAAVYNSGTTLGTSGALPSDSDTSFAGSLSYGWSSGLPSGNTSRSVELWLKTNVTGYQSLVQWGNNNNFGSNFNFQLLGDQVLVNLNNSNAQPSVNAPYNLANGQWHQVVVTFDGALFTFYADGASIGTWNNGAIGTSLTGLVAGNGFTGNLDELAIYNRVLTAAEVSTHFVASGNSQPAPPATVTATAGANSATVGWTASPVNPAPVTGYLVTAYAAGVLKNAVMQPPSATSVLMSGLSGGTSYTFDVAGINNFGVGAHSAGTTAVIPTGSTTYASTVLGSTPSLYFRLGDGAGSVYAADSSGSNQFANLSGTYTLGSPGAVVGDPDTGLGLTNGQLQYFPSRGLPQGSSARTVELWVRTSNANGSLVGWGDNGGFRTRFQFNLVNGNQVVLTTNFDDHTFTASRSLADGFWHYIVLTYDGNLTLTVYIDGTALPTQALGAALGTAFTSIGMVAGRDEMGGNNPVVGTIDELAIYSRALTAGDVTSHFGASGEAVPNAPTGVSASPSTNSAAVSWTAPTPRGPAVTNYVVTPIVDGTNAQDSVTVTADSTSVNIPGLRGSGSYTFQVNAVNQFGNGPSATSAAVTVNSPASYAGLGQSLFLRRSSATPPRGIYNGGWVSSTNVPAMSTWTVEGFIWGMQASPPTTSNMAWGLLGGSPTSPSANTPVAGINFNIGVIQGIGACCDVSYVWPGGSYRMGGGIPAAMTGNSPAHWALDYDGANVRGFINGVIQFTTASTTAAVPAAPAGFYDQSALVSSYFDEFRISNTARYAATFPQPTTSFANDANALLLYNFKEYPISKLPAMTAVYNGSTPYVSVARLAAFADWSGHGNHASTITGYNACCAPMPYQPPLIYQPYILRPGLSADEVSGSGSPWECACHFPEGNYPIDTATGEFWHTFNDIQIPGRGPGIDLSRTYSSHNASTVTRFGAGWTDSYNESLTVSGNLVTVRAGNGSAVTFANNAGIYTAASQVLATLVSGTGSTYIFTDKSKMKHTFNSSGQLISLTDRNGYVVTLTYDVPTNPLNLRTVADQWSRTLTFTYTGSLVNQVQDSAGRAVAYIYSGNQLTQFTDIGSGVWKFTYDASNQMLTMKDPTCTAAGATCNGGNGLQNVYTNGQVTRQTDYMGRVTNYDYTSIPYTTKVTDPKGNITLYEYVGTFLLSTTKQDPGGAVLAVTSYSYDPNSIGLSLVTDPNGTTTTSTRDSQANLLSVTDALGRTGTTTYNSFGEPLVRTDPGQVQTTHTYDTNGNVTQSSRPLVGSSPAQSQTYLYTYGDTAHPGDVTQMTDPDGKVWLYAYDTYGYRTSVTDPLGYRASQTRDSVGRLTAEISPKGNVAGCGCASSYTTNYTVNPWGQPLTKTDPLFHQTTYTYDLDVRLTSIRDANLRTTTYVYNLDGEQTEIDRPDTTTKLFFAYDANGNVTRQTDGLNHSTTNGYDALDHKTSTTDALNRTTGYGYDAAGNLLSVTDPAQQTTTYTYDLANQIKSISYSDGATPNVTGITYDPVGQRIGLSDGTGSSNWAWDSLHRLTSYTNGNGAQVKRTYNLRGLVTTITYPGNLNVTRGYDNAGRWTSVQDWNGNLTNFAYDANSNLTTETLPAAAGVVDTFTFDNANRLMGVSVAKGSTNLFSPTYTRDPANQLTSDTSAPSATGSYQYTALNQLCYAGSSNTGACSTPPSGSIAYQYDAGDNVTKIGATIQAFDNANQLCWTASTSGSCTAPPTGATRYRYDTRGNRAGVTPSVGQAQTLVYDRANRLTRYAAGSTTTYAYNADGVRMSKAAGITTQFVWDVAASLPMLLNDGTTAYVYGPGGLPLEQISGSTTYYFHHDQLGSTRLLTDSSGTVQATYSFDPYGNVLASTGSIVNPFRFSGQYQDAESGFYYLRARYYDPTTTQFLTRDPMVQTTMHPYAYASGTPLNETDPSGMCGANDFLCLARTIVNTGKTLLTNPKSWAGFPAAVAHSGFYLLESIASSFILAPYAAAYGINKYLGQYLPQPVRSAMSAIQRWSLHADMAFDRFQAQTGYPGTSCPPENDEGKAANWGPSVFFPKWTGSGWGQEKFPWGPPTPAGGGRDEHGVEHYAD